MNSILSREPQKNFEQESDSLICVYTGSIRDCGVNEWIREDYFRDFGEMLIYLSKGGESENSYCRVRGIHNQNNIL